MRGTKLCVDQCDQRQTISQINKSIKENLFTSHFKSLKAFTVPVAGLMENAVPRSLSIGDQVKSAG